MTPARGRRIPTLDLIRGIFMVAIIVTHALNNVMEYPKLVTFGLQVVLSGTVGFATVSGMLVGYFLVVKAGDLGRIVRRYRTQGLRLLLVAHPLMALALFLPAGVAYPEQLLRAWYITDSLAVLFLFVVPLLEGSAPRLRLALGAVLLVAARAVELMPARSAPMLLLRDVLAGVDPLGPRVLLTDYALMPLLGVFLVGSYFGHAFAVAERDDRLHALARTLLLRWVPALLALCLAMVGAYWLGRAVLHSAKAQEVLYPDYFFSLYPYYLALTLTMSGIFMTRAEVGPVQRFFIVFGKTSLFIFVVQYYFVETLPYLLGWRGVLTIPQAALFAAVTIGILNVIARVYNAKIKKS